LIDLRSLFGGRRRAVAMKERLPEGTYIELVQSLFGHVVPAVIMTLCFAGAGAYILTRTEDWLLTGLYAFGLLASAVRLGVLFGHRSAARSRPMRGSVARVVERRFGLSYIAFAAAFGAFAARSYAVADTELHILMVSS
jgi:hypothetical protein